MGVQSSFTGSDEGSGFFSEEETKKAQPVFYNNTRFMDYFLFL